MSRTDLLQGALDLMIPQILASMKPQHGYAVAARLEQGPDVTLQINVGALYPGLVRLEQRGLVRGRWERMSGIDHPLLHEQV